MVEGGGNLEFLLDNHTKYTGLVLEGGSRSGKTVDTCQFIGWYLNNYTGKVVTIGRDKLTTLKKTLILDWRKFTPIFDIPMYNKSEMYLEYNGNLVRFVGLNDDLMAAHGLGGNVFWLNEAMSIGLDTFDQLEQRNEDFFILDYNPSATLHWIYNLEKRKDVKFFKSTVLDNTFAPPKVVNKILSYEPWEPNTYEVIDNQVCYKGVPVSDKNQPPPHPVNVEMGTVDKFMWEVYGLGLRSQSEETVYKYWGYFDENEVDLDNDYKFKVLGLDFGYTNDPSALIEIVVKGNNAYLTELLYKTGYTNPMLADEIVPHLSSGVYVVCDSAEPKSIAELHKHKIPSYPARKGQGSINWGIDVVKSYKLHVNKKSVNLQNELINYKFKKDEKTGDILNVPIDKHNHLLDALRYGITKYNVKPD